MLLDGVVGAQRIVVVNISFGEGNDVLCVDFCEDEYLLPFVVANSVGVPKHATSV